MSGEFCLWIKGDKDDYGYDDDCGGAGPAENNEWCLYQKMADERWWEEGRSRSWWWWEVMKVSSFFRDWYKARTGREKRESRLFTAVMKLLTWKIMMRRPERGMEWRWWPDHRRSLLPAFARTLSESLSLPSSLLPPAPCASPTFVVRHSL